MKNIILFLFIYYGFILFSGLNLFWSFYPYDGFRVLQIVLIIISSIYLLFQNNIILKSKIYFILFTLMGLLIYSSLQSIYPLRALQEVFHFLGLLILFLCLIKVLKNVDQRLIFALSLFPLLTLIFLPVTLFERVLGNPYTVWTQSFVNVRMLDDALLPCLFLIWYFSTKYLDNKKVRTLLFIASTLFFLNFILNGSRAIFLSIIVSFIFFYFISKRNFYTYSKIPAVSFLTALILHWVYKALNSDNQNISLVRYSSSGRIEIWSQTLEAWSNHSFWGIGGNHLLLYIKHGVLHPHNLPILLLSEFGLIVFILILYLFLLLINKILKDRKEIPVPLLVGIVGIAVNSMLSGSMVYPASQTLNIFYIAFALSFIHFSIQKTNMLTKIFIILVLFGTLFLQFNNITCMNCMSVGERQAPRFWNYGIGRNLIPYDEERIGQNVSSDDY